MNVSFAFSPWFYGYKICRSSNLRAYEIIKIFPTKMSCFLLVPYHTLSFIMLSHSKLSFKPNSSRVVLENLKASAYSTRAYSCSNHYNPQKTFTYCLTYIQMSSPCIIILPVCIHFWYQRKKLVILRLFSFQQEKMDLCVSKICENTDSTTALRYQSRTNLITWEVVYIWNWFYFKFRADSSSLSMSEKWCYQVSGMTELLLGFYISWL